MVKSSFQLLAEACREHSFAQYSAECAVPVADIEALAREFTSHGTRAAVVSYGGTMSANGFYSAWAIMMLNVMIGNLNARAAPWRAAASSIPSGGAALRSGELPRHGQASRGLPVAIQVPLREDSPNIAASARRVRTSIRRKSPGSPISGPLLGEHLDCGGKRLPYRLKAWINHMGNPLRSGRAQQGHR